eukprot:6213109-Pleurochrysis_carterae.AAC.2
MRVHGSSTQSPFRLSASAPAPPPPFRSLSPPSPSGPSRSDDLLLRTGRSGDGLAASLQRENDARKRAYLYACMCECACACECACVCACACAHLRACVYVCACTCLRMCVRPYVPECVYVRACVCACARGANAQASLSTSTNTNERPGSERVHVYARACVCASARVHACACASGAHRREAARAVGSSRVPGAKYTRPAMLCSTTTRLRLKTRRELGCDLHETEKGLGVDWESRLRKKRQTTWEETAEDFGTGRRKDTGPVAASEASRATTCAENREHVRSRAWEAFAPMLRAHTAWRDLCGRHRIDEFLARTQLCRNQPLHTNKSKLAPPQGHARFLLLTNATPQSWRRMEAAIAPSDLGGIEVPLDPLARSDRLSALRGAGARALG